MLPSHKTNALVTSTSNSAEVSLVTSGSDGKTVNGFYTTLGYWAMGCRPSVFDASYGTISTRERKQSSCELHTLPILVARMQRALFGGKTFLPSQRQSKTENTLRNLSTT